MRVCDLEEGADHTHTDDCRDTILACDIEEHALVMSPVQILAQA